MDKSRIPGCFDWMCQNSREFLRMGTGENANGDRAKRRWGHRQTQMGTPVNAIGDVHFCKKCTSPIDIPVCLRYTLKVKIIESQINIGEYL